ncbi:hypothetical protein HPB47_025778 [Ixodes persulcatus]|uniref:Uncharacterized protein n=1 Tax=Ixodes persulcatus TaxID=34615 RepID=A0AC60Q2T5_IXOPE|nr:hypothetical protein HPB47_025778 [Ixodes persulcatus]
MELGRGGVGTQTHDSAREARESESVRYYAPLVSVRHDEAVGAPSEGAMLASTVGICLLLVFRGSQVAAAAATPPTRSASALEEEEDDACIPQSAGRGTQRAASRERPAKDSAGRAKPRASRRRAHQQGAATGRRRCCSRCPVRPRMP